jgi:hypothetical protein
MPLPEKISNAPKMLVGLDIYFNAFTDLSAFRNPSDSLRWESVNQYCKENDITGIQRENMFYHLSSLDKLYIRIMKPKDGDT